MAKGDGSITKVSERKWRVCISLGFDPITNKRKKAQKIVNGTKADARKVRDELRRQYENGLVPGSDKITFGEFSTRFHEARVIGGNIARSKLDRDASLLRTLNRYIGHLPLKDLKPDTIEMLYARIKQDKTEEFGTYSNTTMHMYHVLLKMILQKAVDLDIILRNPCNRVTAPKADTVERRALNDDEMVELLVELNATEKSTLAKIANNTAQQMKHASETSLTRVTGLNQLSSIMAVRLALSTGMRRGEVFGLCWDYVDLNRDTIAVQWSLTAHGELKHPKSAAGHRVLSIDKALSEHLAWWCSFQRAELVKIGVAQSGDTPVCCSSIGGFITLRNFSRWWSAFREEIGFPDLPFHSLRHTQATQLLKNGEDIKTVQHRLGHSTASLTLDVYGHAIPEKDREAANIIGDILSSVS